MSGSEILGKKPTFLQDIFQHDLMSMAFKLPVVLLQKIFKTILFNGAVKNRLLGNCSDNLLTKFIGKFIILQNVLKYLE